MDKPTVRMHTPWLVHLVFIRRVKAMLFLEQRKEIG